MSIAWTGDGIQVIRDKPEMKYKIGTDGGEIWTDSWSVAADAPHKAAAYAFLKFMVKPENAAKNADFILFPSADPAVTELCSGGGPQQPHDLSARGSDRAAHVR